MFNFLKNIIIVLFSLFILELVSQSIILVFGEKKYSFLLKPFSNTLHKNLFPEEYKINWDYSTNKMVPGVYKINLGNKEITYNINSKGFRGDEFNLKTNKKRIISFGGSTTIGLESNENQTYPKLLETLLNKDKDEFEVLNFGFGGKSLNYIKSLFFNEAVNYEPDIITIYSNRNSIMYDGSYVSLTKSENEKIKKITYFFQENIMTYRILSKIIKRFYNYTLEEGYLRSPFSKKGVSEKYLLEDYKNSLEEIISYSKAKNIQVILIKQAFYINPKISQQIKDISSEKLIEKYKSNYFIKNYKLSETEQFWLILGTIINKELDELKNYSNVKIVNPVPELLKNKENFVDFLHLTPEGNLVLAKEIYKILKL